MSACCVGAARRVVAAQPVGRGRAVALRRALSGAAGAAAPAASVGAGSLGGAAAAAALGRAPPPPPPPPPLAARAPAGGGGTAAASYKRVFMAAEATPSGHGAAHVGLYYKLDPPPATLFPEGLPRDLTSELATTRGGALMIRAAGRGITAAMDAHVVRRRGAAGVATVAAGAGAAAPLRAVQLPRFRILCGEAGVGKSAVLAYAVHHARTSGWIALCVRAPPPPPPPCSRGHRRSR